MRVTFLIRMYNMISMKVKLRIYKAAILPYLTYCSLVWHFCRGSGRRKLDRINERGLYNRRLQDIAILMCKVKFKLIAANLIDLFSVSLSSHNLRHSVFFIPRFNAVKYGRHSIRYLGSLLLFELSKKDSDLATLSAFKPSIRKKGLLSLMHS